MPHYEMMMVLRRMSKSETVSCVKRTCEFILDHNGVLRKIENFGTRTLPYSGVNKMPEQPRHRSGAYFMLHFDIPPEFMLKMDEKLKLDLDVIKATPIIKQITIPINYECTIEDELKPPVFREPVQRLIRDSRRAREKEYPKRFDTGTKLILR